MDSRLVEYIKKSLDRGLTPEQIRNELLNAGWESKLVEDLISGFSGQSIGNSLLIKKARFPFLIILTLVFVITGLILMFTPFKSGLFENISGEKAAFANKELRITKIADYDSEKDGAIYALSPKRTKIILNYVVGVGFKIPGCEICKKYKLISEAGFLNNDELIFSGQKEDGQQYLVRGEKELSSSVWDESLVFSEDKKHFAYVSSSNESNGVNERAIFLDEREITKISFKSEFNIDYFQINNLIISPDGNKVAFVVSYRRFNGVEGDSSDNDVLKEVVYVNDKPSNDYAKISPKVNNYLSNTLRFSPDSQRIAYVAKKLGFENDNLGGLVVVIDNRELETEFTELGFSRYPEAKLGFSLHGISEYESYIDNNLIRFSPDGQHFLFETPTFDGQEGFSNIHGSGGVVIDGVEKKYNVVYYNAVYDAVFSSDSKHVAYFVREKIGETFKETIILDDKIFKEFGGGIQYAGGLGFTKKNEIYYAAKDGQGVFIVIGERMSERYKNINGLKFSPNGLRNAFLTMENSSSTSDGSANINNSLIIDGVNTYQQVLAFQFSPDSHHYAFYSTDSPISYYYQLFTKDKYLVVDGNKYILEGYSAELRMDENSAKAGDMYNPPVFSEDSKEVRYNVIKDNAIYLVTIPTGRN